MFRDFGQDDQSWVRQATQNARNDFRAAARACAEDFSMPAYTMVKPGEPRVSVGPTTHPGSQMYSESPFEKATHRDSKELLSGSKPESQPLSFWTFSYATSGVSGIDLSSQVQPRTENLNFKGGLHPADKEEHQSAAAARCAQNPFLSQPTVSHRLTENNRASQKQRGKFKQSLSSVGGVRNSNSIVKERKSNTSTSSCGSLTKSNKTIRKNKSKLTGKGRRQDSLASNPATSETRQIIAKNNKIKLQGFAQKRHLSVKSIAGKQFIA